MLKNSALIYITYFILGGISVGNSWSQSSFDYTVSFGIGVSQHKFKDFSSTNQRLAATYNPVNGFYQSLDFTINKKGNLFFLISGIQHHSATIRIKYHDFKNPLIKYAEANQQFELRYFSYPLGFGRKFNTGKNTTIGLSIISEILATYRLKPVDSEISVVFKDNTTDNLAKINDNYRYNGFVGFGSVGCDFNLSFQLNKRMSVYLANSFIWMPQTTTWFSFGSDIYAGGQVDAYIDYSPIIRNLISTGLKCSI